MGAYGISRADGLADGNSEQAFYDKVKTAQFYFGKFTCFRTTHAQRISTGVEPYMSMDVDQFALSLL